MLLSICGGFVCIFTVTYEFCRWVMVGVTIHEQLWEKLLRVTDMF